MQVDNNMFVNSLQVSFSNDARGNNTYEIPNEILFLVFQYLSLKELINVRLTCKAIYQISMNNSLWEKHVNIKQCFPKAIYGENEWNEDFGLVIDNPPKMNIASIFFSLNKPCPFQDRNEKLREKVWNTHKLFLLPKLTSKELIEIAKTKQNEKKWKKEESGWLHFFHPEILKQYGDISSENHQWVLIANGIIKETKQKNLEEGEAILSNYEGYKIPSFTTAIINNFIRFMRFPSESGWKDLTFCRETIKNSIPIIVGTQDGMNLLNLVVYACKELNDPRGGIIPVKYLSV